MKQTDKYNGIEKKAYTMTNNKVIRTICYFTKDLDDQVPKKINAVAKRLEDNGYEIQTKRICSGQKSIKEIDSAYGGEGFYLSVGSLTLESALHQLDDYFQTELTSFNLDLSKGVTLDDVDLLYKMIKNKPDRAFLFTFIFNNTNSTPFLPSSNYQRDGFSIGLQSPDLSEGCKSVDEWLQRMKSVWNEIVALFDNDPDFLGIDSSVASLFSGKSSFTNFIKRIQNSFSKSVTTDTYLKITKFIKEENPKPIGLCGLMFPCLEDFELAEEYEQGNFTIERNVFLSLHSGLGIDTYPIGIDEPKETVFKILILLQGFSQKYNKALSARLVTDGNAKIGDKTDFQNQYLKDVTVRAL